MTKYDALVENIQKKINEKFKSNNLLVVIDVKPDPNNSFISEMNVSLKRPSKNIVFKIDIKGFFVNCGVAMCGNYTFVGNDDERIISLQFFEMFCEYLYKELLIGAIIACNYTGASIVLGNLASLNKHTLLKDLGFEIESWWNNTRHNAEPTKNNHWISGVFIKKLDKFDIGMTKEEMNQLKRAT